MKLKPYPQYKESGVPWLGMIPKHWEARPLKRWVTINGKVLTGKEDPDYGFKYIDIGSVGEGSLTASPRHMRFAVAPSRARRVLRAGDTLISTVRPYLKAIYYVEPSQDDLVASTGFAVLTPPPTLDGRCLFCSVLSEPFIRLATMHSVGASYPAIEPSRLGCLPVAMPPTLEEQSRISAYLGLQQGLIQHIIHSKRQQIKLLNEQKQVIINQAVTRGLDPNVRMKPSGVEWIGDVPEHWQMTRLKYLAQFVSGGTPSTSTPSFWNGNIPWVSPKDMKYFEIHDTRDHVTERAIQAGKTALVPAGAVLMVVRSGILQRTIPVAVACREVAINQDLKAIIVDDALLVPEFLSMVVIGNQQALLALWRKQGATVESLEYKWILDTVFPVPPVQEQRAILTVLLPRLMEIEKTIEHVQREIDLLHEYRTRLIADVVTGKLDVRGVELPDIDVSEGLDEWDGEEEIGQEEIIEPEEMDVDEDN